jgi:hypothetical protein
MIMQHMVLLAGKIDVKMDTTTYFPHQLQEPRVHQDHQHGWLQR